MRVNHKSGMTALEEALQQYAQNIRTNEKALEAHIAECQRGWAAIRQSLQDQKDDHVACCRACNLPPPEDWIEHEERPGSIQ